MKRFVDWNKLEKERYISGCYEGCNEVLDYAKYELYWPTEELSASQEGESPRSLIRLYANTI